MLSQRHDGAHVTRNAGGRAPDDAICSLTISQQLPGADAIEVAHHTDCGMPSLSDDDLRGKANEVFGVDPFGVAFSPFSDVEQSLHSDVRGIREHPMIPASIPVRGYVYDVRTGRVRAAAFD